MILKDLKNKQIHFIGVGGIGMSGIAQLLAQKGYHISGSDLSLNENARRIEEKGVQVVQGHDPENLREKDLIVVSTGIQEDNPELKAAKEQGLPILHRADMLALLMEGSQAITISGTHGKTTSTALMGWVLETAGLDPTVINGGVMNKWKSNIKEGKGTWHVVEADESDGSFLKLPKEIALVTNMDCEHMDHYGTAEKLCAAFETFSTHFRSPGVAVLGIDHPSVYTLWQKIKTDQPCLTYGFHPEAEVRAENVQATEKGVAFDLLKGSDRFQVSLSLWGQHNVQNALGVAAIAFDCGIGIEVLEKAFSSFEGVERCFSQVGEWKGIKIIDDYAHHPVEIRATLEAARNTKAVRVIAVLEPHRYSRLEAHFKDFSLCCERADVTIVLPVYSANESPRVGVDHKALSAAMPGEVYCCDKREDLPKMIQTLAREGDMVVCLGAGSISSLARKLPIQLNQSYQYNNKMGEGV